MPFTLDDLKKITATPATPAAPATRQMTPPPGAKPDVKQDEQPKPQFKLDQLREITGDINPVRKAKEYLFGKPDMPTTPGQQYVEAKDSGVIGNLWNKFMALPTGTGKTVGQVEESIFNPLGRTNLQQERAQTNEETRYKEATEGRGVAAKAASSALSGIGGLIEGQTSPFNMALLFAGPVKAAASTAEMASEAPSILGKLAHFGFASQMAIGAVDEGQASADAFMKGDYESGIKLAVGGLTSALMAREGVTDMVAQERVNRDLDGNAQSFYKKPWKKLTPQEQVSVVYQVAKADAPLIADLQRMQDGADSLSPEQQKALQEKANQFLETQGRIRRKGFTPPPSEGASEIHQGLETRQQEAEARPAQNAAIVAEAYKQRTAAMDQRQAALDAEKSEKDRIQNLRTVETDYLKDKKEKAEVDDFFGTLQAQSPAEREALAFDKKVGDAWGDLYAEQNRQRAVKDSEEAEAAKRAADQGPTGLQIVDKRAMGAQAQVILDEIEQSRLPEKSANPYLDLNERVNNLADALEPGRNSETVWENLRRRQRDGDKLSDQERDFVRTYARRRMAEIQLAKGNKVLGERLASEQRELDANIFAATERAERLSDAADSLQRAAERGGDVESADKAAKAAIEAHRLAEEAITERQQEQARRHAMRTGGLIVEKGPAVPVVAGRPVQIYLPDGRSLPARYGAVRLSQLIASHDPFSFEPNPNYKPERMQPRRLESDKINQARITLDSAPENYRGNLFTSDDPTSQQGPPVILEDGRVAGGNSRLLRLKRALETPSRDAIIKNLHDQFEKFGIGTPDLIDRDDPYIPVRILDETPENYEALVELGDILNRDHMMGMSSSETSVLAADKLTNEDVDQIGLWMEAMPEGSTLRSVLAARGQDFLEMMIKRGVILESKRASFMTDNVLNEEGKSLFERMILGRVINDPKLIDTVPKELLFKVERALPSWFRLMSAAPEWDITDRLKDALKLWKKIEAVRPELQDIGKASDSMVDKYLNPTEFTGGVGMLSFGGDEEIRPKPHPAVLGLAKLLEENSLGNKRAMEKYADESHGIQTRLLGNSLTPVEAFNEFIVGMKGEQVKPEEWLTLKPVSDEASEVIESMSRKESTENKETERAAEAKNPNQMAPPPLNTKSKRKLSPPPSDMVTLYRAEKIPGSGRPIPDWVKDDPKFQKSAVAEGRWFTSELSEAQEYLKEAGFGGDPARIVTVEIPKSDLDKHRAANNPEAAKFVHSTKRDALNDEFFLPRELAEKASLYKPKPPVAAVEKKINALPDVGKVGGLTVEGKVNFTFGNLGGKDLYSAEDTEQAIGKAKELSDEYAKKYESASLAARKDRTAENLKAAEEALFSYKIRLGEIHMMESHLEWIKRQPEGAFLPAPKTPMAGEVVEIPDLETARAAVDLGALSSGKITRTMEFGNRRYVPVQTTNGEVHLAPLFTPEEWGNRVVTGNVNPERGHQGNPITFKGKKYILGGKESQIVMRARPTLPEATDRVASAAMNGVVTPQSLRDFFEADPRTEKYAEPLIRVLTEVMPRATGKTLPEFLRDHLQDVRFGREADFHAGRESLAQSNTRAEAFYLKSQQLVEQKMRGPMPGDDVAKMLRNNGVKPDEMKWTGLDEFLSGKKKVTAEEVHQHLAESGIKIEEVTKQDEYDGLEGDVFLGDTKYGSYVIPGGKNYRELLLTMPSVDGEAFNSRHWNEPNILAHIRFNEQTTPDGNRLLHLEEIQSDWHQKGRKKGYKDSPERNASLEQAKAEYDTANSIAKDGRQKFKKLNDALNDLANSLKEGEDTTYYASKYYELEEERSALKVLERNSDRAESKYRDLTSQGVPDAPFKKDWHEMSFRRMVRYAAENGFDGISWTPGAKQNERYSLSHHIDKLSWERNANNTYDYTGTKNGVHVIHERQIKADQLEERIGKEAAKRIIEKSAKHDAKALGYTAKEEKYGYTITDPSGKRVATEVNAQSVDDALIKQSRLMDIDTRFGNLEGEGLEVGGSGMKGFYDKIIPEYANKFGKRWNARVERKKLAGQRESHSVEAMWSQVADDPRRGTLPLYAIFDQAGEWQGTTGDESRVGMLPNERLVKVIEADGTLLDGIADVPIADVPASGGIEIPYLPINAEMKKAVMEEGVSLFQRSREEIRESLEITRRVYAKSVELQKEAQRLLEKHDIGIRAIIAEENDTFPDEVNNAIRAYLTERKRAFEERKQYRRSQEQTTPEKTTSGTVEYKGTSRDLGPLEKGGTVKGVAEFLDDQRSLITLFEHADPATVLHEFFHAMRPNLLPEYQATLESFAGVKNGIWDREAEEKVARAWEKYHYDGKAPTPGLKAVFDQLKDIFRQIYSIIKGSPIDVKLTKEVRELFDGWYGKQEDLSPAKKVAKVKDLRTGLKEVSTELENAEGTIGDIDDHLKKSARGDINSRHLDGLNRIGGAEITEGIPAEEQIRDGRYHPEIVTRLEEQKRLMKSEIDGLRSAETKMKDQLKSIGGDRQLTPPPGREMTPPPSAETVTAADRKASTKKAVMGAIQDRLADARTKVFETQWDAIQWVQQHAKDLHGAEVWQRPQGDLFVEFVPKKTEMLFQQEGLADQIRRLERLKRAEQEERDPLRRAEMKREILRLNGKLGMGQEGLLSFTPKPKEEGIIRPFSSTPGAKKEDVILLASPTEEESRGNARGTNADETSRVQNPEGSGEVHGRAGKSGSGPADGESGRGSTGRGLAGIEPVRIAPPKRVAAQPGLRIATPEQWAVRTRDLNMPDGLPVPSIRLSDNIAVMLMFPGQREIVETALTALDQYDGAVIASPPGSGKTYLSLAVTRHFVDDGAKKILILTKNEDVIENRKGFRKIGKNTFGINVERLPSDVKNLKDGVYITTHATMRTRNLAAQSSWDLVIADESAEGRNWQVSGQGKALKALNGVAKKMLYVSATPFHTAVETGYMDKLGLWRDSDFPTWARQFGVYQDNEKMLRGGNDPKKLIKLRQQLIERGQFVTQEMNYDGFKADFAKVPLTEEHQQGIRNIDEAFSLAERYFRQRPNGEKMIAAVRGNSVMYMKNYLERIRLPQVVEMMREAKRQGWQVGVFSEHSAGKEDIDQYLQEADRAMGGKISQLLPKLEGVYDSLKNAFGDDVVNYSGSNDTTRRGENNEWVGGASRDKDLFMEGKKNFMFSTYAKGGVGVSMHDDAGNRPRMAIYLGPPWSGIMLDQALGRFWRYGTKSNVHSVFMVSDAAPEVDMIVNKIAPRMESLRAAINGVDGTDPLVKRMRSLTSNQNELDAYTLGQKVKANTEDFLAVRQDIPIANWKSVQILDAAQARNKGMRYPGMVQDQPGIILLQADFGKPQSQPPRFLSVEDAKARLLVSDMAGSVAEGEDMPGADGELEDLEPGERMKIANDVGVQATISAEDNAEGNPSAAVRTEFETNMIALKRAKNSVEATPGGPDEPVWKVTSEPPEGGWGRKIKDNDKTIFTADMVASADNSILSIGRQIGSPEIAWDIVRMKRGYFATMANHGGDWSTEFMKAVKGLTDEEFSTAWLVKEGNMASPSSRISEAVEAITKLTDRIGDQLETAKIQVTERDADGRPVMRDFRKRQNYMPHIFNYNEKITVVDPKLGTSEEFTLGELLGGTLPELKRERIMNGLEAKTGWDRAKIEDWISRKSKERRTKIAGNVERSREEDLPFYRTDAHAFFQYIEQTAEALSRTEVFGQSRQNLDGLIAQLPNQKARSMVNTYFEPLFKPTNFGKLWSKVYGSVTSFEIATKMTFSPVKVPFHMVHMTLAAENVGSLAKGIFAGITNYKELRERAVFSGALSRRMAAENLFESGNPIKAGHAMLGAIGFNKLYEFDRVVGNFIGENYMEQKALPEMMRKGKNADRYRRVLVDTMLIHPDTIDAAVARGRWTKEDLARAGAAFTNRTMFTDDPMEMPSWARSQTDNHAVQNLLNLLRTAYSMKTFMLKTGNLLKEQVIDQARKGNYRPLMYFATLYPTVGGESLRFFGSLIHGVFGAASQVAKGVVGAPVSGQETSQWDKYERELSELFTDPSVGKTAHRLLDNAALATGWDLITHFVDPIIFPPASKKARASARKYMWDDLEDNLRGPIWTDLINAGKYGAKVAATVTDNEKGEGEKLYEETAKWLVDTVPAARPYVPQNFKKKYSMAPPPR